MRYDLLIFDWDGTLADSAAHIVNSMQQAIAALELPPRSDAQVRELIGLGLMEVLQRLYPGFDAMRLMALLDAYRQRYVGRAAQESPLFEGVGESLQRLHASGYRLAIATGKSRAGLRRALATHLDISTLISSSRCADETASKPHPLMLEELLEEEGVAPDRALMIGDTEFDVAMARAVGMPAVGVACGVHEPTRIMSAGALAMLDAVRELPAWLAR